MRKKAIIVAKKGKEKYINELLFGRNDKIRAWEMSAESAQEKDSQDGSLF